MVRNYRVDELLKVRASVKDLGEVVGRMNGDAAVREHVLRSSSSGLGQTSSRSRARSSSIITNPYESSEQPLADDSTYHAKAEHNRSTRHSKYSPTPSIKRGKAEKLLKEHGSPPGMRVTAGGRIVPNGLPPLMSPRFVHGFGQPLPVNNNANVTNHMFKPLNGVVISVGNGNICQIVDGDLKPVEVRDGQPQLYMPPANPIVGPSPVSNIDPQAMYVPPYVHTFASQPGFSASTPRLPGPFFPSVYSPPTRRELAIMETAHEILQQELRALDRNEVLQKDTLTTANREDIAKRRIQLVNRIDENRRGMLMARKAIELPDNSATSFSPPTDATNQSFPMAMNSPFYSTMQAPFPAYQFSEPSIPSLTEIQHQLHHNYCASPNTIYDENTYQPTQSHPIMSGQGFSDGTGLGIATGSKSKPFAVPQTQMTSGNSSMNFDGTSQQPRRSHAIQIKKPNEDSANKSKQSLNPASPVYKPGESPTKGPEAEEEMAFVPSPGLIAEMTNLMKSPEASYRQLDNNSDETAAARATDSSASTADFFPLDSHRHSTANYEFIRRDPKVNLPAWMIATQAKAVNVSERSVRPSELLWNDYANENVYPKEPLSAERRNTLRNTQESVHASDSLSAKKSFNIVGMDPNEQNTESGSVLLQRFPSNEQKTAIDPPLGSAESKSPISYLLHKATERASSLHGGSPVKSDSYLEGFRTGIKQDILAENRNEDYRRGYRDGLIESSSKVLHRGASHSQQTSPVAYSGGSSSRMFGALGTSSVARAASFPNFHAPGVPVNSLSSSPAQMMSPAKIMYHSGNMPESTFDSNVQRSDEKIKSTQRNEMKPIPSNTRYEGSEPPSPLATRFFSGNQTPHSAFSPLSSRILSAGAYDQQRFSKGLSSIARSHDLAQGNIKQLEGIVAESATRKSTSVNQPNLGSPTRSLSVKIKGPGSPVKMKASAAMAKFEQLAGISKKERGTGDNSSPTSPKAASPEKDNWRTKWSRREHKQ